MDKLVWKVKTFEELSTQELYNIFHARTEVFVLEQNIMYQDFDYYDQKALHLFAESNARTVAYCRLFAPGIKYPEASIGRVLTMKSHRGTGLGKVLIQYAIEVIGNRFGRSAIRISAQDYLLQFYSDFGFADTGKKYLEDTIPHSEMIRIY